MASLAGSFLIAKSVLQDPNFHESVVLLIQHSDEGAFGLVVNRRAEVEELPFPLYLGGPCPSDGLMMLHGHADWMEGDVNAEAREVAPGVYLGDAEAASRIADLPQDSEARFRMFKGYSGWGAGQLEHEIAVGAWAIVRASGEALFDTPIEEIWSCLLPPAIPQPSLN